MTVEYIADEDVNEMIDQEIRRLLCTCFTRPQDVVFQDRRYCNEPYPHHWMTRDAEGALIAHLGLHEKQIESDDGYFLIGGVAEVCVHPDHRGTGCVKAMIQLAHEWMIQQGVPFSVLFGGRQVYGSSGYARMADIVHGDDKSGWKPAKVLVKELSALVWPSGSVRLPGPKF